MGFFQDIGNNIRNYFDNRFANRLERGLRILENRLEFKPVASKALAKVMTIDRFSSKLIERYFHYLGDPDLLRGYYAKDIEKRHQTENIQTNYFWEIAPSDYIFMHTGIPGLISRKMATIIFGNGFDVDVEVFKTTEVTKADGTKVLEPGDMPDEKRSENVKSLIDDVIIPELGMAELFQIGAETESWAGHIAMKLSYDSDISPYPILECYDPRNFVIVKKRGKTIAIVFRSWNDPEKNQNKKSYRLDEIYTTVREGEEEAYGARRYGMDPEKLSKALPVTKGDAAIRYELHRLDGDKDEIVAYQNWPRECSELTEGLSEVIVFPGLKRMLAFEKANKLPNNEFPGSVYGGSDYDRSIGSFDKLDELWSENGREVRENKDYVGFPESFLPKDTTTGKRNAIRDPFKRNFITMTGDVDQNANPEVKVIEIPHKTESLLNKWKWELSMVLNNAEMSPLSIGVTGLESANSSDVSQRERSKATLEMRKKKLRLWEPYINNVFLTTLELISWIFQKHPENEMPGLEDYDIDFTNCNVKVHFPDYIVDSETADTTQAGTAYQQGIYSIETAVRTAHRSEKWDDEKVAEEVERIKFEKNMATDNPNALSIESMLGNKTQPAPEPEKKQEPPANEPNPNTKPGEPQK